MKVFQLLTVACCLFTAPLIKAQQSSRISFSYIKGTCELNLNSSQLLGLFNDYLTLNQGVFIERVHVFVDSGVNQKQAELIAMERYNNFKKSCVKQSVEVRYYITSHKPCLEFKPETWERIDVYYRWTGRPFESNQQNSTAKDEEDRIDPLVKALKDNEFHLYRIEFVPGDRIIKSKSYPNLARLVDTLNQNKELHGIIQGHVCCYDKKWQSRNRAKEVHKQLISKGVEKSRLSYVGMGNSQPLSFAESTEAERQLNRRVDVVLYTPEDKQKKHKAPKHVSLTNFKKR